jgi:hypothetical protein
MPALAKCTPEELKDILLEAGWKVYNSDRFTWSLVRGIGSDSVEIPRKGRLVSFEVLYHVLEVGNCHLGTTLNCSRRSVHAPNTNQLYSRRAMAPRCCVPNMNLSDQVSRRLP